MNNNQTAVAYLRTSSAANLGADKDSEARQRDAIKAFADANEITILDWYFDAAVSGADHIEDRPGFASLLDRIDSNGVRTILIEEPSRFARSMKASVLGEMLLQTRKVQVYCANGEQLFDQEDDMRQAMSQIAMVFSELEKNRLVKKLRAARDRKSAELGRRIEGRKPVAAVTISEAKRLYRRSPKTGKRRSLREIARELEILGHNGPKGKRFNPNSVRQMLLAAGVYH